MSLPSQAETAKQDRPGLSKRLRQSAERALGKIASTNFVTAKSYYRRRLARADRRFGGRSPLLIYTMGKVGSSSVLHSLKLAGIDRPLYHLHSLAPEPLRKLEQELRSAFPDPQALVSLHHVWRCQHVIDLMGNAPGTKIQAISLIRDPLARNVSNFFQHIDVESYPTPAGEQRWKLCSSYFDFETVARQEDVSELIELYFAKEWHDFPTLWIDRELKGVLGINVYATDFPREQGYAIYHSDQADLLLIRLRDLNRCASPAIQAFLDLDAFALVNANVGEDKAYVDVYRAFKNQISFPASYLNRMYDSSFVKHFYSEAERHELRARWAQA